MINSNSIIEGINKDLMKQSEEYITLYKPLNRRELLIIETIINAINNKNKIPPFNK